MTFNTFRLLSIIEGLSLLFLLFVAMPAKYQFNITGIVPIAGITHGCLWLAYVVLSLVVSHQQKWSVGFWVATLGASVVPFACFILERKLKPMTSLGNT
ncbi:MAG: DUF3817 domain-containing protein [Moraxellaceae bacterium]|nr:DUF3817 domain-containing protein [Moraxellaceae bacterium]